MTTTTILQTKPSAGNITTINSNAASIVPVLTQSLTSGTSATTMEAIAFLAYDLAERTFLESVDRANASADPIAISILAQMCTPTSASTAEAKQGIIDLAYDTSVKFLAEKAARLVVYQAMESAPRITSNGGGATASINVVTGNTAVTTVTATDDDIPAQTLTYSISGGADAAKFSINSSTGVLTFASAPDFGTPTDANTDNVYEVTVRVSDGIMTDTQAISVTVTAA